MLLRLLTKRHLQRLLKLIPNTLSSPVVVDSMVIVKLNSSPVILTEISSNLILRPTFLSTSRPHFFSNLPLSAVLFLRNTSLQSVKVSRKQRFQVSLADSLYLVFMLTYMMVHTMKSTLQKWHSTSQVLWRLRML